jgi:hypothetical protein
MFANIQIADPASGKTIRKHHAAVHKSWMGPATIPAITTKIMGMNTFAVIAEPDQVNMESLFIGKMV